MPAWVSCAIVLTYLFCLENLSYSPRDVWKLIQECVVSLAEPQFPARDVDAKVTPILSGMPRVHPPPGFHSDDSLPYGCHRAGGVHVHHRFAPNIDVTETPMPWMMYGNENMR